MYGTYDNQLINPAMLIRCFVLSELRKYLQPLNRGYELRQVNHCNDSIHEQTIYWHGHNTNSFFFTFILFWVSLVVLNRIDSCFCSYFSILLIVNLLINIWIIYHCCFIIYILLGQLQSNYQPLKICIDPLTINWEVSN